MDRSGDGWRAVRLLSLTSLLADISGEMLMAVLPFLLVAQGATGLAVGLVGATSEATGHIMKAVGGRWGDRIRRKRALVASGYLIAALSRFGIALAATWPASLFWRSTDRVGKGIRTAPRDALLSAAVPKEEHSRAFGYHRAADTGGAVLGVVGALALLGWGHLSAARVVLAAAIVGLVAVVPLLALKEPDTRPAEGWTPQTSRPRAGFIPFVAIAGLFSAGQVSYLFFLLRAGSESGILAAVAWYLLFNVVYAAAAYPFGLLGDAWGKSRVFLVGTLLMALASLLFVPAPTPLLLGAGFVCMGLAFAATEGTGRAIAAGLAGSKASTHLGTYHAAIGLSALAGGAAAGYVWDAAGPAILFLAGSAAVLLSCLAMLAWMGMRRPAA